MSSTRFTPNPSIEHSRARAVVLTHLSPDEGRPVDCRALAEQFGFEDEDVVSDALLELQRALLVFMTTESHGRDPREYRLLQQPESALKEFSQRFPGLPAWSGPLHRREDARPA